VGSYVGRLITRICHIDNTSSLCIRNIDRLRPVQSFCENGELRQNVRTSFLEKLTWNRAEKNGRLLPAFCQNLVNGRYYS